VFTRQRTMLVAVIAINLERSVSKGEEKINKDSLRDHSPSPPKMDVPLSPS
jgi:hypothetical protein